MGISESDTRSISIVGSTASDGIVSFVGTTRVSDTFNDVVATVDGVVVVIGGMIGAVDDIAGIFCLSGVVGMVLGVVNIIKGGLFRVFG